MRKNLFGTLLIMFMISVVVFILPIVYAANSVQEALEQQISQNQITYASQNMQNVNPQELLLKAIQEDPQIRAAVIKFAIFAVIFAILMIIDLILRGIAMWKASKREQKTWFWFLLVVNSMCILPIIYLIIYRGKKEEKKKK